MGFFSWIIVLFVLGMTNFFIGVKALRDFVQQHGVIRSVRDLEDFKVMVRRQMYQALIQIVLLGGMTILSVVGILLARISFSQFIMVLILDGVVWYAGKRGKSIEHRAQRLKVENLDLQEEYKEICRSWNLKPLPDF